MAINFPATPAVNDTYTYSSRTWQWNGTVWNIVPDSNPTFSSVTATNITTTNLTATNATLTNIIGNTSTTATPTSSTHITNKNYVDTRAIAFSIGLS